MKVSISTALKFNQFDSDNECESNKPPMRKKCEKISVFVLRDQDDITASPANAAKKQTQRLTTTINRKMYSEQIGKRKKKQRMPNCGEDPEEEGQSTSREAQTRSMRQKMASKACDDSSGEIEQEGGTFDNNSSRRIKRAKLTKQPIMVNTDASRPNKKVNFGNVEVFNFGWTQGYDTVPTSGLISLGMEAQHHSKHIFKLEEYARFRRTRNKVKMANWRNVAQNCSASTSRSSLASKKRRSAAIKKQQREKTKRKVADRAVEQSTSSEEVEAGEGQGAAAAGEQFFDQFLVLEPLRRAILENCGVTIEEKLAEETLQVIANRIRCGCRCAGQKCDPEKCECAREGIKCQVDILDEINPNNSTPCWCSAQNCKNPQGRIELDQIRIQNHFRQTIMRLKAAKKMGLDESGQTHSPQHIFFRDEDDAGEGLHQSKAISAKEPISLESNVTLRKKKKVMATDENGNDVPRRDSHDNSNITLFPTSPSLMCGNYKKTKDK